MYILSPEEMRFFDKTAHEQFGIDPILLMENAGKKSAEIIEMEMLEESDSIAILCGTGNNGGDGMVIGRWLHNHGFDVCCYIIGDTKKFTSLAKKNHDILQKMHCEIQYISSKDDLDDVIDQFYDFTVIIDALFGVGLKGDVQGFRKNLIEIVNELDAAIIAIDIPSGLDAEKGTVANVAINSDITITMANMKYGHLLYPGRDLCGEMYIVDIGIPLNAYEENPPVAEILPDILQYFPIRERNTHKGNYGKIAIIAGSPGMTGAGMMASNAALEMGSGLITLLHPKSLGTIFEIGLLEVMTRGVSETKKHTFAREAVDEVLDFVEFCDAVVIGPGISRDEETAEFVREFLFRNTVPAVIDADAINAFEHDSDALQKLSGKPYIFTPHIKEFSRMIHVDAEQLQQDLLGYALEFAKKYKLTLLLKGSTSIIASKDGNITFNVTGNPGLATGGSGDVLSGIIGSLLGQHFSPYEAARVGAYIHGEVADILLDEYDEASITPSKLISNIHRIFIPPESEE
ncbi:MAG: NAD(P)H-hydrate dehydratase [Candidatus Cloacimonetes bacterium]|nr:NAD(P)H-hydrate dehydratase [Candidatus Cloacimonadota bacterium]